MRKLGILVLLLIIISPIFAQRRKQYGRHRTPIKWLSIAPKLGYGGTLLFNKQVFNDVHITGETRSPAYFFGGRFGFTHGDNVGISFEGGKGSFTQKYTAFNINNIDSYDKSYEFTTIEYGALLRISTDLGFIFEIGPRVVQIQTAESQTGGTNVLDIANVDIKDHVTQKYTAIVLGLGQSLFRSDRTEVNLSVKASYGLKDLFTDQYLYIQDKNYNTSQPDFVTNYKQEYKETNPFTIMATIEFNYFFAFWGDASCGKGRFLMFK